MINREGFNKIKVEVIESVKEGFKHVFSLGRNDRYIAFLADGSYAEARSYGIRRAESYTIDDRVSSGKDKDRVEFLDVFTNARYFPEGKDETDDNHYDLTMELMVYTHLWESQHFLKELFRLAKLSEGEEYPYRVAVPESGREDFIRNTIRESFNRAGLIKMAAVITNGFHTSLRNAFAHSQYEFDDDNRQIWLHNYKGRTWELHSITYDEWTRRLLYSVLLNYHLEDYKAQCRFHVEDVFHSKEFEIEIPKLTSDMDRKTIVWNRAANSFGFKP